MPIALAIVAVIAIAAAIGAAVYAARLRSRTMVTIRSANEAVERRFNVLEAVADGMYILDADLTITHVNDEAERLLRKLSSRLVGRRLEDVVDPLASELVPEIMAAQQSASTIEKTLQFAASERTIEVRIKPAASETLVHLRDVSARAQAAAKLEKSEQRLQLVTQHVDAVLWTTGRDARFTTITGGALHELGLRGAEMLDEPSDRLVARSVLDEAFAGRSVRIESPLGERWLRHHVEPVHDLRHGDVSGAVGVSIDITELKRAERAAWKTAHHDRLTGLPNRLSLERSLAEFCAAEAGEEAPFALLFIDLDRFKAINDTLGHDVGDEALRITAGRLTQAVSDGCVVARPGGDEFIVIIPRRAGGSEIDDAARDIITQVRVPLDLSTREVLIGASIGVAMFPEDGRTARSLISRADIAMYEAKRRGGSMHVYFEQSMEIAATDRMTIENELRGAAARGELRVQYQPIVETVSGKITGCEALVRWEHPVRGLIGPDIFLPLAEETGLIVDIDRWVLDEACRAVGEVRVINPDFGLSVNASPRTIADPEFAEAVIASAKRHRLPLEVLSIEITERGAINDEVIPRLERLVRAGARIAIDDFGVGYSSLSYLSRLPIGIMKLDRSFLRNVAHDARSRSLVRSIVAMADGLDLDVIAEGVETHEQWQFIRSIGCGAVQGFHFSQALTLAELIALLARGIHDPGIRRIEAAG